MLSITALSHTYPSGVDALRDVTLQIARGEFIAIVGPSGCGKSTLLRTMAGLVRPTLGQVILEGTPVIQPTSRIGIMFQDAALLPWRTVEGNVRLPLEVGRRDWESITQNSAQSQIVNALNLVGLSSFAQAYPKELSGGMAQRVALARALITQPPVLLLDEPFGALDAFTRESLTTSLERIASDARTTVVMVTHNIAEAVFLADRVVVLSPRPGQVAGIVSINLTRPRGWNLESSTEFGAYVGATRMLLAQPAPNTSSRASRASAETPAR
jgi:NitT/TauT family transport system ATP-binding protein